MTGNSNRKLSPARECLAVINNNGISLTQFFPKTEEKKYKNNKELFFSSFSREQDKKCKIFVTM
jgi:hypothetical protein